MDFEKSNDVLSHFDRCHPGAAQPRAEGMT